MEEHDLRKRPRGYYQCTRCRAAFRSQEAARQARLPCPEIRLAHGHRHEREHVVYPTWYDRGDGHGPDRLCDEHGCPQCVGHNCACDVCTGRLKVPALRVLTDSREGTG